MMWPGVRVGVIFGLELLTVAVFDMFWGMEIEIGKKEELEELEVEHWELVERDWE